MVTSPVKCMPRRAPKVVCALIGGKNAEIPGEIEDGNFDVYGFVLGVVERPEIVDTSKIEEDDILVSLSSTGLHTGGYSLVRCIYDLDTDATHLNEIRPELGETLNDSLFMPPPPYSNRLAPVFDMVKGRAQIGGGGLIENVPWALPEGVAARFGHLARPISRIFAEIQEEGGISRAEMYRDFNMGLGMFLVCDCNRAREVLSALPAAFEVCETAPDAGKCRIIL